MEEISRVIKLLVRCLPFDEIVRTLTNVIHVSNMKRNMIFLVHCKGGTTKIVIVAYMLMKGTMIASVYVIQGSTILGSVITVGVVI